MYLIDIEKYFIIKGFDGIDIGMLKLFLLLYAEDIVLLSESETWLKKVWTYWKNFVCSLGVRQGESLLRSYFLCILLILKNISL